jgi:hypothetical protein
MELPEAGGRPRAVPAWLLWGAWAASLPLAAACGFFLAFLYGDAWVLACVALSIMLCGWPLLVRSLGRGRRAALCTVVVVALVFGVAHSECSAPREICLNDRCSTSLSTVECWPGYTGRLGRLLLAARCLSSRPIRLRPRTDCPG